MDSRGPPPPHHHHQHHRQPQLPPPGIMSQHHHHHHINSSYSTPTNLPNPSNPQIITQNSPQFPFNTQSTPSKPTPIEQPLNNNMTYSGDGSQKKKRGRPRKYSPDGGGTHISLGLTTPTPNLNPNANPASISSPVMGGGDSSGTADDPSSKRHRGRPPSSSKRQLDALGNCGVGFTPHVILVNAGEDIQSKILDFSKQGPRTVCILSANGSICNVSLRQPSMSGGVVNYEGRFEIISLSGSFLFSEKNGGQIRTGGLSVSLAGADCRVLGGVVAGMLMAATSVQIVVGSFIADGKKLKYMPSVPNPNTNTSSFASPLGGAESSFSEEASSEGSKENGSDHIDRNMGSYENSTHSMHHMQMYAPMGWPNPGSRMHQN